GSSTTPPLRLTTTGPRARRYAATLPSLRGHPKRALSSACVYGSRTRPPSNSSPTVDMASQAHAAARRGTGAPAPTRPGPGEAGSAFTRPRRIACPAGGARHPLRLPVAVRAELEIGGGSCLPLGDGGHELIL